MKSFFYVWQLSIVVVSALFFSTTTILLLQHYLFGAVEAESMQVPIFLGSNTAPDWTETILSSSTKNTRIFSHITFTGDVMLARSVELAIQKNGESYPFLYMHELAATNSAIVVNFEAAISPVHTLTPPLVTYFSVDPLYIPAAARSGITHASLANNHSLDYGQSGYLNTQAILEKNAIVAFGHSTILSTSSITYLQVGSRTVSLIAIHTLFGEPDPVRLSQLVAYMKSTSDIQLAFIHWGTEYKSSHDDAQTTLANYLVSLGIDGIIGHHPHVVEDIQIIHGVPIFYSLGNFIFDQFFSPSVQTGLVVQLEISTTSLMFNLIPVTSIDHRSQPQPMGEVEKTNFLTNLADKSATSETESIKSGKLIFPLPLAEQPKNSII